jgi:hypothetical protein
MAPGTRIRSPYARRRPQGGPPSHRSRPRARAPAGGDGVVSARFSFVPRLGPGLDDPSVLQVPVDSLDSVDAEPELTAQIPATAPARPAFRCPGRPCRRFSGPQLRRGGCSFGLCAFSNHGPILGRPAKITRYRWADKQRVHMFLYEFELNSSWWIRDLCP